MSSSWRVFMSAMVVSLSISMTTTSPMFPLRDTFSIQRELSVMLEICTRFPVSMRLKTV